MLTDLDFLKTGEQFPPKGEKARLDMYDANRQLFESKHEDVYAEDLKRIERVIGNFQDVVSYPVVVNFQKLISLKIADLLFGEPPEFNCKKVDELSKLIQEEDLVNLCYLIALDVSRYGDGLFYIHQDGIDVTQPPIWFPVVNPDNVRQVVYHVLAWTIKDESLLNVQIHSKGKYEQRQYKLDQKLIGVQTMKPQEIMTGLDNFAIVQVSNTLTSDRVTGLDDYSSVDSLVSELMVRIGQVSKILDKHASPSMSGPASALDRDPVSGQWHLKTGTYYSRESTDDPIPEYITWDGQLSANFTHIERLINLLYTVSEMGSAVFGDMVGGGSIASGTALKRLMMSPLAKVTRIRMRFDRSLKEALRLYGQYKNLNLDDVDITWQDGLPTDDVEQANVMNVRTANKATISQRKALMLLDGLSEEQADEEVALIQDEEASNIPIPTPFPDLGATQQEV